MPIERITYRGSYMQTNKKISLTTAACSITILTAVAGASFRTEGLKNYSSNSLHNISINATHSEKPTKFIRMQSKNVQSNWSEIMLKNTHESRTISVGFQTRKNSLDDWSPTQYFTLRSQEEKRAAGWNPMYHQYDVQVVTASFK